MKSTRRGSDSPVHRREKTPRFQIPLDKWPVSPGTPREASGVPCLNPCRWHLSYTMMMSTDNVVVSDVRTETEAAHLRSLGGKMVRVQRLGSGLSGWAG